MVVYIDVLIVLNLYINYFLLRAVCAVMKREVSRRRTALAALAGAAGALVMLLPEFPAWAVFLYKAALGAFIVFIAFGKQKPADTAICVLFFLVVSFTFAGLMLALWVFAAPAGMVMANGTAYFNIPLSAVIAFTAAAYCAVRLARYIADRRQSFGRTAEVRISSGAAEASLRGLCDTGNGLCDPFSGKGVVICSLDRIRPLVPAAVSDYFDGVVSDELRVIPCRTVSSETLVPVFRARVTINGKEASALVGVTKKPLGEDIDCVFDPKIISF